MNINWYGQTCFRVNTQVEKGKTVDLLIDPFFDKGTGVRGPKLSADIILSTNRGQKIPAGKYFSILSPGEYDVKGVYIVGVRAEKEGKGKTTLFTIETESIRVCHLGTLDQELSSDQIETIGEVDILLLPVGGGDSLDVKKAVKVMSQIEPRIIVPMYYKIPKVKAKLDKIDGFLKEVGVKSPEALSKLNIKNKDLPKEDEAKIIVLKA